MTIGATARTSPASSPATGSTSNGAAQRDCARREHHRVEGARRAGPRHDQHVIAAIDYAIANKDALNIRVINLSLGAGVHESYNTDPLTLAAKRAVDAGIVVVAAAGNLGQGPPTASRSTARSDRRATRRG